MRDQRDGCGVISRNRGRASAAGCSHGEGVGRVLRATAAMRTAAIGRTTAVGPALAVAAVARVAVRLARSV
jgi:hypothetical protein